MNITDFKAGQKVVIETKLQNGRNGPFEQYFTPATVVQVNRVTLYLLDENGYPFGVRLKKVKSIRIVD
jgi:hypothetical protein